MGLACWTSSEVHHRILAEVLVEQPTPDAGEVTGAAGAFLGEVLATFDMAHRALHEHVCETGGGQAATRPASAVDTDQANLRR